MSKTYLPVKSITRTIDADGQVLGRIASEIAAILRGKDKPTFAPHRIEGDCVTVVNASGIRYTGRKVDQKTYYRHTGYLGHLKQETLGHLIKTDTTEPLRRAIYGMLPNNRLRPELMKRLTIYPNQPEE
ncbi:50S ribosomal protein L13 [Candidatus Berkelbacteria bacterium]|nr:50S ribosomal protein L13 [Candidatus Berkelbacteria bacterium]